MPERSDRLLLPLLDAGQAQKELYHNEALTVLDLLLHGTIEASGLDVPPGSPAAGQSWIVGSSPSGAWAGQDNRIAAWTAGGWRFIDPLPGMRFWDMLAGYWIFYDGSAWIDGAEPVASLKIGGVQVVGARGVAISNPGGGSTIDAEARTVIGAVLTALRTHGLIAT